MPDQQNQSQPSFWKEYLPDIKNWLLGAGGAALGAKGVGTAAAKAAPYLGSIFSPSQFRRVLEKNPSQMMHPAVFHNLPTEVKNNLISETTPQAMAYQRDIDQKVMKDPSYQVKPPPFGYTGWFKSPAIGLAREIPDTGAKLVPTKTTGSKTFQLQHPWVDLHGMFNVPDVRTSRKLIPGQAYYFPKGSPKPGIMASRSPEADAILHEFGHAGQDDLGLFKPGDSEGVAKTFIPENYINPNNWTQNDFDKLSLWRHGWQEGPYNLNDPSELKGYLTENWDKGNIGAIEPHKDFLAYLKGADEADPYNIQQRFNNPDLYLQHPEQTQYFPTNELITQHLKAPTNP